jgi:hypothetical protein
VIDTFAIEMTGLRIVLIREFVTHSEFFARISIREVVVYLVVIREIIPELWENFDNFSQSRDPILSSNEKI